MSLIHTCRLCAASPRLPHRVGTPLATSRRESGELDALELPADPGRRGFFRDYPLIIGHFALAIAAAKKLFTATGKTCAAEQLVGGASIRIWHRTGLRIVGRAAYDSVRTARIVSVAHRHIGAYQKHWRAAAYDTSA